jgi:uncharacterized membrane protein YdbT with pleckstrin-like domain
MSYLTKILRPGEHVLADGKLHWIIYSPIILWLAPAIIGVAVFGTGKLRVGANIFILFGCILVHALAIWIRRRTTEIAVTDRRVIYKTGVIRRHTAEMNMDKVESVLVDQSILGRILGYGTIHIRGTGVGLENLRYISSPISLRNTVTAK